MHWFYEHIFPFFQTRTLFFSVTSPHRKPCVCHTHTEKQALYNSSVKSPCSETGEGLWGGGGWGVGVRLQPGRRNLRRCQVTKWPRNSSGFFLSPLRSSVETDWYHFTQKGNNKDKEMKAAMVSSHISKTLPLYTISRAEEPGHQSEKTCYLLKMPITIHSFQDICNVS